MNFKEIFLEKQNNFNSKVNNSELPLNEIEIIENNYESDLANMLLDNDINVYHQIELIRKDRVKIVKNKIRREKDIVLKKELTDKILLINDQAKNTANKNIFNSFKLFFVNFYFSLILYKNKKVNKFVNFKFNRTLNKKVIFVNSLAGEKLWQKIWTKIWQGLFLSFIGIIVIFPFYWMIINSFRSSDEFDPLKPLSIIPKHFSLDAYKDLFSYINDSNSIYSVTLIRFFTNSAVISLTSTFLQLTVSVIAGFGLANWRTKPQGIIMLIMLATVMIPGEALLIGQYIFMVQLDLKNSAAALIVPFISNVFTIYLMSSAFQQVGSSVKKAAKVDGLSTWKYFWKIALPSVRSTILTSFIISTISAWNAVLWPTMVLTNDSKWVTLPMLLWQLMKVEGGTQMSFPDLPRDPQNLKMAGAILSILPMIIMFLFCNKLIIKGMTRDNGKSEKG